MNGHDEIDIRTARPDDWPDVSDLLGFAFHHTPGDAERALEEPVWESDRSLVATAGGTLVAHTTTMTRDLSVPGAVLPAAHVSMVGVAPTHRRRGLLTRLMRRQLAEVTEPIAVLWASEGKIYPRYGFGLAAQRLSLTAEPAELRPLPETGGRIRLLTADRARAELIALFDSLRPGRPGWSSRSGAVWERLLSDPESGRGGGTALRAAVHDGPDGPDGFAIWRSASHWTATGPAAEVEVRELAAATVEAYTALWRLLLTTDLARTLTYRFAAVDEPLQHLVDEPRRLGARLLDGLWVRLVDLPGALAARRYRTAADVVVEVADPLLPANAGRWRLTAGPRGAACVPAGEPADMRCTVLELGAAYLGGTTLSTLAAAGRVGELNPGKLDEASTAFGWHRAPHPIEIF